MKVLYIINSLSSGGAEKNLYQIVSMMSDMGHSVRIAVLFKQDNSDAPSLHEIFFKKTSEIIYLDRYRVGEFGLWFCLYRTIKKYQPDIIHSHLPRSDLAASICKLFSPSIVLISTYHDRYKKDTYSGYWLYYFLWPLLRRSTHYIAVSNVVKEWVLQKLHIDQNKVSVINHGVNIANDILLHRFNKTNNFVIGCIARYEYRKGIEVLINAMSDVCDEFPQAKLLLAGSDPTGYSSNLHNLIEKLQLQNNIKLVGFINDPVKFIDSIDVFAYASITEGFGIVLIEAMSRGCPIVASDISPINEIVINNITGKLINVSDSKGFAKELKSLFRNYKEMYVLGRNGYDRCKNEFSLESTLNRTIRIYDLYKY